MPIDKSRLLGQVLILVVGQLSLYYTMKWLLRYLDPQREKKDKAALLVSACAGHPCSHYKGDKVLRRLKANVQLTEHETMVATDIADPEDLRVSWKDVGGLESIIESLQVFAYVLLQLIFQGVCCPSFHSSGYLPQRCTTSASSEWCFAPWAPWLRQDDACTCARQRMWCVMVPLVYRRAWIGLTSAGCCFINLQPSTFMDKWYGESQKLVRHSLKHARFNCSQVEALFSLARKLQPTLIFIDEIDAFLRERTSSDNESTAMIKAQVRGIFGCTSLR
jgi:hypothetical protein